ncbi:MAG: beta-L-arabinofuranosidase domain-containing protein, partial [Armatimonadota bacterium]
LNKDGSGKAGWEEVPYWLKGYISLAYQLHDKAMIEEAQGWIEAAIASQRPNGDFGPLQMIDANSRDFWGNMLMLQCLRTYYEATGDQRVITMMTKYFEYQSTIPDKNFLTGYWQHARGGDNLASIYWLYNMTGQPFLLDLAEKNHRCTMNWSMNGTLPDWHNVNVAQSFDEPGIYSQQSKNPANLKSAYGNFDTIRKMYGQVPGGMFGGDENSRKGFSDPRQAVETCGMVEQMLSDEELLTITGDVKWADHCENVAFNTYPAAVTPDFTALRYLTSPNMATSDADNHAPGYQNSGPMTAFNPLSHRCCQHNHSQGWPYFSEHLWMASNDDGLVATLYSASTVTAKVGSGAKVTIKETSNYPFDNEIRFAINPGKTPNHFPIYLRLPEWCNNPSLSVEGTKVSWSTNKLGFARIDRTWKSGDIIILKLPMSLNATKWTENHDSMSLNYGPLTFSLKITEGVSKMDSAKTAQGDSQWQRDLDIANWPAYQYQPKSPWNVALAVNPDKPLAGLTVVKKDWPKSGFPFTPNDVPIYITARGAVLPEWTLDRTGLVSTLQQSPTRTFQPIQTWKFIPMG